MKSGKMEGTVIDLREREGENYLNECIKLSELLLAKKSELDEFKAAYFCIERENKKLEKRVRVYEELFDSIRVLSTISPKRTPHKRA